MHFYSNRKEGAYYTTSNTSGANTKNKCVISQITKLFLNDQIPRKIRYSLNSQIKYRKIHNILN